MNSSWGSVRHALLICQVWAFVLFLPATAEITAERNRYLLFWSTSTLLLYMAASAALGLVLFGVGCLLRLARPAVANWLTGLAAILSLFFLVQALFYTAAEPLYPYLTTPLAVGTAFFVLVLLAHPRINLAWARERLAKAAMLLGALPPVFWAMCFTYGTYPQAAYPPAETVAERSGADGAPPADNVYIFVFDAWSYRLTFDEHGAVRSEMPALKALANEACVFTDGHSSGCHTIESLPRLLFQTQDLFVLHGGEPGFATDRGFLSCADAKPVFCAARERGYRTYMVGWHHPYHVLLAERCDHVYSVSSQQLLGPSALQRFGGICWRFAGQYTGPILSESCRCSNSLRMNYSFRWQNEDLQRQARAVLSDDRAAGQFAVLHLPPPHFPFICTAAGIRKLNADYDLADEKLAREQLVYLDGVIGGFVEQLRARNKYDNSMIVLTSDHAWREDPTLPYTAHAHTHVPLVIRFPGQNQRASVDAPFSTFKLIELTEQVRQAQDGWRGVNRILADGRWYAPLADEELEIITVPLR